MRANCGEGFVAATRVMNRARLDRRNCTDASAAWLSSTSNITCDGGGALVTRMISRASPSSCTTKSAGVRLAAGEPFASEAPTTMPRSFELRCARTAGPEAATPRMATADTNTTMDGFLMMPPSDRSIPSYDMNVDDASHHVPPETPADPAPAPVRQDESRARQAAAARFEALSAAASIGSVGLSFVFAVVIGTAFGWWLDKVTGWSPVCLLVFFVLGLAAGFRNVYVTTKRYMK